MAPDVMPIVVDNASSDRTVQQVRKHPNVMLIANPQNRGFAAAVNQGVKATDADFILLLNPDVQLLTSIEILTATTLKHGLAAGCLLDDALRPQTGFSVRRFPTATTLVFETLGFNRLFPANAVNRRYRCLDQDLGRPGEAEQPAGAFLMLRRDVWQSLGGFDERFFPVWFEDVDFCRRAYDLGLRAQYLPSVQARHAGGHSVSQIEAGCRAVYWCVSLLKYAAKHFGSIGYRTVCGSVLLTSFPRLAGEMIREKTLNPIAAYWKIIRFAGRCLISSGRTRALGSSIS